MDLSVCIIDDDEDVREVMCFALKLEGISAITFASGAEAEEKLSRMSAEEYPSLILVDYMMPEMDGIEFIKKIFDKYPKTLARIPMALSTARFTDETSELPAGAMRLEKPVDLDHFVKLVRNISGKSNQVNSLNL